MLGPLGMVNSGFHDRREAGQRLARELRGYAGRSDVVVLGLPRGGVPVAAEVARALRVPMDVFIVRKLGIPGYEELAMGAVATGGVRVVNDEIIRRLGIPSYVIDAIAEKEQHELRRRERLYRGGRPPPDVKGRTVILVDDGLATGATMQAAVKALKQLQPARIVVAVPTAARETCELLKSQVDKVVCAITPEPFLAVGHWYDDFSQTTDDEVRALLAEQYASPTRRSVAVGLSAELLDQIQDAAQPLRGEARDYDRLLERIGDARFVLLGEASHGTHEFYEERAKITRRLIEEKGFSAVAVEADWPDAWRASRYAQGDGSDIDANEALADFRRFPTWMWRNTEVRDFIEWLRAHNAALPDGAVKTGFYGLDLYSLHASMKAVIQYLEQVDPEAAQKARARYACFDHFGPDPQVYGFLSGTDVSKSCEEGVVRQLLELQRRTAKAMEDKAAFYAEQNARVVKNAEHYYRSMFLSDVSSWNLRDSHMVETLHQLDAHLSLAHGRTKFVIWAHNSHLGDARATQMGERGELNVGQLVRERYGRDNVVLMGFTTHHGTVTAASDWGAPAERKQVRPGLPDSYEALFHDAVPSQFMLTWRDGGTLADSLRHRRIERAIGVIYRPETERQSHYFWAQLPDQFDCVLHFDETRALQPLETTADWEQGEVPETFPFAV
ncbi:MAG: Erythromycin esterase [Rhodospirillales bacterium]|nr:Erythromycin esterase [Rhodospirillales bacterium]